MKKHRLQEKYDNEVIDECPAEPNSQYEEPLRWAEIADYWMKYAEWLERQMDKEVGRD